MRVFIHEYVTGGGMAQEPLAGGWFREGRMMRDAAVREFGSVPGVEVRSTLDARLDPDAAGAGAENGAVPVDRGEERTVVQRLAQWADWTCVIAPEAGDLLAERVQWVTDVGGRSLGCTAAMIRAAGDKWRTYELISRNRRLETPATWRICSAQEWPNAPPARWILKPIDGAGCIDTWFGSAREAWPEGISFPVLLQEFVDGMAMSASCLVGGDGSVVLIGLGRQSIARVGGRLVYRGGWLPCGSPDLARPALELLREMRGAHGWVGVDFVADATGRVQIIEVNPRLTTSFAGFVRLLPPGAIARAWIALAQGGRDEWAEAAIAAAQTAAPIRFAVDADELLTRKG